MPMQNFGVTNKQYYGMLWCFLEWSIAVFPSYVPMRPHAPQPNPQSSLTPQTGYESGPSPQKTTKVAPTRPQTIMNTP